MRLNTPSQKLRVGRYTLSVTRMWSPEPATASSAVEIADNPDGIRATPAQPSPSMAASACSSASEVGVPRRPY